VDEFDAARLDPHWQWPWDRTPKRSIAGGVLRLQAAGRDPANPADTIVARSALTRSYTATVRVARPSDPAALAGLSIYGDAANAIGLSLSGSHAILWRREKGSQKMVTTVDAPAVKIVDLRVTATGGSRFQFAMSADGETWQSIGENTKAGDLPPWDRAVRIALAVGGPIGSEGRFEWIRIEQGS
jgi:beta-xylosidase